MRLDRTDRKIAVFLVTVVVLTTLVFSVLVFNKDALAFVKNVLFPQKKTEVIEIAKPKKVPGPVVNTTTKTPEGASSETKKTIGRNDPCPCGAINPATGEVYKYKKCGLINAPQHRKSLVN